MTVLVIHQSAELYGSDKTLLYLVQGLGRKNTRFVVVLPSDGPLKAELQKAGAKIVIAPVIKISRQMFAPAKLLALPFQLIRGLRQIRKSLGNTKIDIVYSNTLAVFMGAFYSRRYRLPHLWHVHEIIAHPKIISEAYPRLLKAFSDKIIYNSEASRDFMVAQLPKLGLISSVVHNGMSAGKVTVPRAECRRSLFGVGEDTVVIALVGRISRWKGQSLLLEAFAQVQDGKDVMLVFVGSPPPGQDHFLRSLEIEIGNYGLREKTKIIPFTDSVWDVWNAIDIAVVPSTEPEPFGLVAVEAMLSGKPVIGAAHGGLLEIVVPGKTGLLFEPSQVSGLAECLQTLIDSEELRDAMGRSGRESAIQRFSLQRYCDAINAVFLSMKPKE